MSNITLHMCMCVCINVIGVFANEEGLSVHTHCTLIHGGEGYGRNFTLHRKGSPAAHKGGIVLCQGFPDETNIMSLLEVRNGGQAAANKDTTKHTPATTPALLGRGGVA